MQSHHPAVSFLGPRVEIDDGLGQGHALTQSTRCERAVVSFPQCRDTQSQPTLSGRREPGFGFGLLIELAPSQQFEQGRIRRDGDAANQRRQIVVCTIEGKPRSVRQHLRTCTSIQPVQALTQVVQHSSAISAWPQHRGQAGPLDRAADCYGSQQERVLPIELNTLAFTGREPRDPQQVHRRHTSMPLLPSAHVLSPQLLDSSFLYPACDDHVVQEPFWLKSNTAVTDCT